MRAITRSPTKTGGLVSGLVAMVTGSSTYKAPVSVTTWSLACVPGDGVAGPVVPPDNLS